MTAEIALVLILMSGAASAFSSFRDLVRVDPGFVADGRIVVELTVPTPSGTTPADVAREFSSLMWIQPPYRLRDHVSRPLCYRRSRRCCSSGRWVFTASSVSVNQRKREICMRMALGASPAALHMMVLRQMLLPLGIGVALCLTGMVALSRVVSAWVTAAPANVPWTVAIIGMLSAAVLGATVLPTRRATRTVLSRGLGM